MSNGQESGPRKMGPLKGDHPSIGQPCPACWHPFKPGDYVTLVAIGPGDDKEARRACREGRVYNALAVSAHYACVTGIEK